MPHEQQRRTGHRAPHPRGPEGNLDADTNKVVTRFGLRNLRKQGRGYAIRRALRNVDSDRYAWVYLARQHRRGPSRSPDDLQDAWQVP